MGENNGNGSQAQNVKKVKDLLKIQKKKTSKTRMAKLNHHMNVFAFIE